MSDEYTEGWIARSAGFDRAACPHGWEAHHRDLDTGESMGLSPLAKRHWWLAGWHDRDMELESVIREGAA